MGSITAGQNFGQDVAQAERLNEVATPRAAFGVNDSLIHRGREVEQAGLQEEHEQKVARQKAEDSMSQAKLYGMRDKLGYLVDEIDREVKTGTIEKTTATKVWQERSAKVLEDGLPGISDAHRERATIDLRGLADRLTSKVGDSVRDRDRHDTLAGINTTLEYTQRMAVVDPAKARQITVDTLDQLGPHAGLAPDVIAKRKQTWIEETSDTNALTAVQAARRDNRELAKVEKSLEANKDLDPKRRAVLLSHVDNYRAQNEAAAIRAEHRAEIAAARRDRESTRAFTILSDWAMSGKSANPDAAAPLVAKLVPEHAAAYKAMAAEIPKRTVAAMLPLETQQQQLDALYSHRTAKGTSQELEHEVKRREQVLAEAKRDYKAEPLRAAQERGVLDKPLAPLNMTSIETIVAGLSERVQQAQSVSTRTGRPESPLLSEEASKVGDMLNGLAPAARGQRIAQLATIMPPGMAKALALQIAPMNKPLALQMAAGTTKSPEGVYAAELIARGVQVKNEKAIKDDSEVQTGTRARIFQHLGAALQGPVRDDVAEAAHLIFLGQQAQGGSGSIKGAIRMALGGDIIEHNGNRIPVPFGVDSDALKVSMRRYGSTNTPSILSAQTPDGMVYLPGGRAVSVTEFAQHLPDMQLEPVGTGRYRVRTPGGSLAMNLQAKPIVVEVGDAPSDARAPRSTDIAQQFTGGGWR